MNWQALLFGVLVVTRVLLAALMHPFTGDHNDDEGDTGDWTQQRQGGAEEEAHAKRVAERATRKTPAGFKLYSIDGACDLPDAPPEERRSARRACDSPS